MRPLSKSILNEIEFILNGIEKREFNHNQEYYHRGNYIDCSHCFAGWKTVLDAKKLGYSFYKANWRGEALFIKKDDKNKEPFLYSAEQIIPSFIIDNEYARQQWKLTKDESYILFNGWASISTQRKLLEYLKLGKRIMDVKVTTEYTGRYVYILEDDRSINLKFHVFCDNTEKENNYITEFLEYCYLSAG